MQAVFEKIIEKLENELKLADEEKLRCARENPLQFDLAKGYSNGVANSIEIVKLEAEKYNNGWIPCSSGVMPRANGWYLVTNHLGVVQEQRWSANHWEKLRDDAVLAWRELPQPYTKGEHDENNK